MEDKMKIVKTYMALLFICNLFMIAPICAAEFDETSSNLTNTYVYCKFGDSILHIGYGEYFLQFMYGHMVKIDLIDGVKCLKGITLRTDGNFDEFWLAQDVLGDVYILQYSYWSQSESKTVFLGKNNAGLFMPKNPKVGDKIFDSGDTVIETGVFVPQLSTGLGPFSNCLKVIEVDGDIKYIAPKTFNNFVKKEYPDQISGWELKETLNSVTSTMKTVVIPISK
jgi:hypothetical protein